ncbi:hypothetical protein [Saccharicrinis sp. FJH54]|uniref:hypothetical protein n=1 Tax=Saccharicrinis sp. FJH54 TaxID=3344665 RepID=UPI0035D42C20
MKTILSILFFVYGLTGFGQNIAKIDYKLLNRNDSTSTLSFEINFEVPMSDQQNNPKQKTDNYHYIDTLKAGIYNQLKGEMTFYQKIPGYIYDIIAYIESDSLKSKAISTYKRETYLEELITISSNQYQIQNGKSSNTVKLTISFVYYNGVHHDITLNPVEFYYHSNPLLTNTLNIKL